MLHDGHHEQRIAVRARIHQRREPGRHRPPQPPDHIRRHVRGRQKLQPQVHPLPPPTQLLDHAAQRMPLEQHLDRPIRPQHQQPCRCGPLRQVGEALDRRAVTPLQVFQHQQPVGRQHLQRLGKLAQHADRRQPGQAALEPLQFRLTDQARQVRQPHRRILPQHGAHRVPLRPLAQLPQGFQKGQVRFAFARVLDTLPPRRPHRPPSGQAGQVHRDHRRLPHARFPTDEDELPGAVGRPLAPRRQELDFVLTPYQETHRPRRGPFQLPAPQPPITLVADRDEVPRRRRCVAQRHPNLPHTYPEHGRRDIRARPHVLLHLGFGYQAAGMRRQIAQHRQGPRAQGNQLVAAPQAPLRRLQPEGTKGELMVWGHRASSPAWAT
jgi:hypothetical protein